MGLFSPWFLGGLLAVGLPVWLHLLKRHKTDPTLFPSLMFFEHREQSSVQHRRLDYILLFILRTAMLVLLALLFAHPYITRLTPKGAGERIAVIAVDRSFSMRTAEGTQTRLDRAKQEALDTISGIPANTKAQVIALGGTTQAMTQQTTDPNELRAAVAAIQPSDSRASFGELSRYLRTLSENTKTPVEAHLFSDLQKSGLPPGFTDLRLDPDTTLALHRAGSDTPNWTVENVIARQKIYDPKKVRIQATIAGFGTPAVSRKVTLSLNGKIVQQKSVEVPENGRATAEFLGLDASYGFNKAEIKIEPGDALAADNRFQFSVERTDPKKVLFVDTGRGGRAELYFRTALDANADAAFTMETSRPDVAANAQLANYAVVVLNDPGPLPGSLEDSLKKFVNAGGSVLISLGATTAVLPRVPVTDEPIESSRYAGREGNVFLTVTDLDTGHFVTRDVTRFEGVKFYQAVHVTPQKSAVLARLNDQTPLLLERQMGEGKVLVFTSRFDNIVNDLPQHGSWVAFVQRSVGYLGAGGVEPQTNLAVDQYVELRSGDSKGSAEVMDPDGKRALTLDEAEKARSFALNREGFFEVRNAAGRRSLIAAHADRKESDLTVIPKETQDLWAGANPGGQANPGGGPAEGGEGLTKQQSLAPFILLLLLGVALAESLIANRYLRSPASLPAGAK